MRLVWLACKEVRIDNKPAEEELFGSSFFSLLQCWVLARIMAESSFCFRTGYRNSVRRLVLTLALCPQYEEELFGSLFFPFFEISQSSGQLFVLVLQLIERLLELPLEWSNGRAFGEVLSSWWQPFVLRTCLDFHIEFLGFWMKLQGAWIVDFCLKTAQILG